MIPRGPSVWYHVAKLHAMSWDDCSVTMRFGPRTFHRLVDIYMQGFSGWPCNQSRIALRCEAPARRAITIYIAEVFKRQVAAQ